MDEEYDAIVLGTGLKECIISGLLSVEGLKVLHMDRNNYYGGESASLNLIQLFEKFKGGATPPEAFGPSRDYNIDMVPKFMMANGKLVKALIKTDVTKYLEFKAVDGSYVQTKGGKIHKVPATDGEALKSSLMGLFEKRRARAFFIFVQDYELDDPKTHKGHDLTRMTMLELYTKFGLEATTIDFIGHSLALMRDDNYLGSPALPTVRAIKLYSESMARFNTGSPYIYPLYGLGELPQAFARLSAVYGGTYMLNKPDAEVVYNDAGEACGVISAGETAKCKFVVGDPAYFPSKVKKTAQVVRCICIMNHPIPNTNDSYSCQIVLPQKQLNRKTDMYVFCTSYAHNVSAKNKWIGTVCTTVETDNPEAELAPGLALLGHVEEKVVTVSPLFEPLEDGSKDKAYISTGYDATTHFESVMLDVMSMYKRITGKDLDLTEDPSAANVEQ
mmetsp:Transcript_22469/g.31247  ORF Transcript_22469/g.31247 Transcript_22469/m.31247 type:complete len:445 (-) Transcript_22469:195-1529(-)